MSEDLHIKVVYDIDDSKLQQSLAKVQSNTSKALGGGSGSGGSGGSGGGGGGAPQTAIDKSLVQAGKLNDRLNLLRDTYSKLANQPGQERNLAKVTTELATQYSHYKNMAKTSSDYLSLLEKEVSLRKQAAQLTNTANKNEGVYSAHSQRQFQMLQQISAQVPGGSILNKFISGATRGAAGAAEGGASGGLGGEGLAGGLAGGGMAAAAGVAALAVAAVVQEMGKLAARAQELSQSASSASSSLGQLRSQTERGKIQQDANAVSGGVTVASVQQSIDQTKNSILGGIVDFITGKSPQDKQKDVQTAISGGLGGDDKEQWRRIKEQGQDTNLDLARQRQSLDISQQRQVRDFNLEQKSWNIDVANQKFDLQKTAQRQEQDYRLSKQQYDENFAGKMAKKQFDLSQQYATQAYQISQQRATQDYQIQKQRAQQDFGISLSDRAYDFGVSRQRAQQDLQISMSDKAYDFGVSRQRAQTDYTTQRTDTKFDFSRSMSRNQQQFNIDQSRQGQDYQENLQKMALSGADGKSYMFASMDYRKQVQRQQEDFARQKQLATEDINTQLGRGDRDFNRQQGYALADFNLSNQRDIRGFNIGQSRNLADYNLANQRDIRGFGISQQRAGQDLSLSQQRAGQDFSISQKQAMDERALQIEGELYSRKYQGIQLELQHNRNLQDSAVALQRFNQAVGLQAERFGNQAHDINQDQALQNRDFDITVYRALRGQAYNEQDFAGAERAKNPLGAYGQSLTDPTFAAASARYAQVTGQLPLDQQVQSALNPGNTDWGNSIGQILGQAIPIFGLAALGFQAGNALFGGGGNSQNQGGQGANFNPMHNVTFPTVGGVSQNDFQALQQQYLSDLQALDSKYASIMNATTGGNNVFTGY